jgi:hypothetical protein
MAGFESKRRALSRGQNNSKNIGQKSLIEENEAKNFNSLRVWGQQIKLFCFRSDNKLTKSKRFAFVLIISGPNQ